MSVKYSIVIVLSLLVLFMPPGAWAETSTAVQSLPEFIGAFPSQKAAETAIDESQAKLPEDKKMSSRYSVSKEKQGESYSYIVQRFDDGGALPNPTPKSQPKSVQKKICGSLANFLYAFGSGAPETGCVYVGDDPMIAAQSTQDGLLVYSLVGPVDVPRFIYIYKGDPVDANTVDNQRVEPGYFEYQGVLSYQRDGGEHSIYAFSRVH